MTPAWRNAPTCTSSFGRCPPGDIRFTGQSPPLKRAAFFLACRSGCFAQPQGHLLQFKVSRDQVASLARAFWFHVCVAPLGSCRQVGPTASFDAGVCKALASVEPKAKTNVSASCGVQVPGSR